jgi:hypothetical protein
LTRISLGPADNTSRLLHIFPVPQMANTFSEYGNVLGITNFRKLKEFCDFKLLLWCKWGLFWDGMQRWLVVGYRCFDTAC